MWVWVHETDGENEAAEEEGARVLDRLFKPVRNDELVQHDWKADACRPPQYDPGNR